MWFFGLEHDSKYGTPTRGNWEMQAGNFSMDKAFDREEIHHKCREGVYSMLNGGLIFSVNNRKEGKKYKIMSIYKLQ